jgi:hypothetical protein
VGEWCGVVMGGWVSGESEGYEWIDVSVNYSVTRCVSAVHLSLTVAVYRGCHCVSN